MEDIVLSFHIAEMRGINDEASLEEHLAQLMQLEEDCFVTVFHQHVEKDRYKSWHDQHIKNIHFQQAELVLLYDSKFSKHLGKLQMHWMGPYIIIFIIEGGVVQLQYLDGDVS